MVSLLLVSLPTLHKRVNLLVTFEKSLEYFEDTFWVVTGIL